jgi:transcription elongation GreA/GreB family factor
MIKEEVHQHCLRLVQQKLAEAESAILEAQRAANDETKSSVGDKYETGRAMMHLEQEKLAGQRTTALRQLQLLHQINPHQSSCRVGLGSLVHTSEGFFYLAAGIGRVRVGEAACYVISTVAPLGQALRGKHPGDEIQLNGRKIRIIDVS